MTLSKVKGPPLDMNTAGVVWGTWQHSRCGFSLKFKNPAWCIIYPVADLNWSQLVSIGLFWSRFSDRSWMRAQSPTALYKAVCPSKRTSEIQKKICSGKMIWKENLKENFSCLNQSYRLNWSQPDWLFQWEQVKKLPPHYARCKLSTTSRLASLWLASLWLKCN